MKTRISLSSRIRQVTATHASVIATRVGDVGVTEPRIAHATRRRRRHLVTWARRSEGRTLRYIAVSYIEVAGLP